MSSVSRNGNYLTTKSDGQSSQDILFLIPISFIKRLLRNTELDRIGLFYWSFHLLHFHLSFYSRVHVKGTISYFSINTFSANQTFISAKRRPHEKLVTIWYHCIIVHYTLPFLEVYTGVINNRGK